MTETTFTREAVTAAFEAIIAEYGADHTYEKQDRGEDTPSGGCFYSLPEKDAEGNYEPACIVGVIIDRLDPALLQDIGRLEEEQNKSCGAPTLLFGMWYNWSDEDGNLPDEARILIDDETGDVTLANALSRAQSIQDVGGTWGEAFAEYRDYLALADALD